MDQTNSFCFHLAIEHGFSGPSLVLDAARAKRNWDWQPALSVEQILEEIAAHAEAYPGWLKISGHA
jgi:CDP-paratose 2-epimerase